jgi:hypothetical protein
MKKIMYCAALLTALTFTSCTKDEPNVTPEPETPIASDSHLDLFLLSSTYPGKKPFPFSVVR